MQRITWISVITRIIDRQFTERGWSPLRPLIPYMSMLKNTWTCKAVCCYVGLVLSGNQRWVPKISEDLSKDVQDSWGIFNRPSPARQPVVIVWGVIYLIEWPPFCMSFMVPLQHDPVRLQYSPPHCALPFTTSGGLHFLPIMSDRTLQSFLLVVFVHVKHFSFQLDR